MTIDEAIGKLDELRSLCCIGVDLDEYVKISENITVLKRFISEQNPTGWISVEDIDSLPKDREWVLVWHTGYKTPKKARYKADFGEYLPVFVLDGDSGNDGEVTHWQPLPEPPKGE